VKIAVLTSSRADYGIYVPLLKELDNDPFFDLRLIVFGTHLSPYHGMTIRQIEADQYLIDHQVSSLLLLDDATSLTSSMALTMEKFASIWSSSNYDLIICLGDRFETFAAVAAAVPFNLNIAHIHAGEISLGAIDNQFRDAITLFSKLFFTSTETYAERLKGFLGPDAAIYNVGALSLDNIANLDLYSREEFAKTFNIDISIPSILITFHPETIGSERNQEYVLELVKLFTELPKYQLIITMPNADTNGSTIRQAFHKLQQQSENVVLVENFGSRGYFSCMKHCSFLLGNTSSGILEAASFGKYVINIGDRQRGRVSGKNVFHCPISKDEILDHIAYVELLPDFKESNIYWKGGAASQIISVLKQRK
jgi:GDP/UDP-N,N'-diacetylbacillosamine 2-epimerase (hydrolysing)